MQRLIFLKVGFLSALGSFMLLLSLFAFTGTASAHTINAYGPGPFRPQLNASVVSQLGSSSVEVRVSGSGFRPGTVFLSATAEGRAVSVQPIVIHTNRAGFFSQLVRINLPYQAGRGFVLGPNWMYSRQITLHAFGQGGQASTQVILSSWPFQYGLVR